MYILLREIEICDIKYYNIKTIIKIIHKTRKKNEKIFRNILKIILIILLYNIILLGISTIDNNEGPGFCGFKSYIITTSSMEPDIKTGDVVICQKTDAKDLKEGDVITFNKNGEVITHRIIKIETNDEINYYITKGDNNTLEDNEKVEENQIKGKMVIKIPKMGNFIKALSNNIFLLIILLVILILSFIKILVSEKRDDRRKKRKIEEKRKS